MGHIERKGWALAWLALSVVLTGCFLVTGTGSEQEAQEQAQGAGEAIGAAVGSAVGGAAGEAAGGNLGALVGGAVFIVGSTLFAWWRRKVKRRPSDR